MEETEKQLREEEILNTVADYMDLLDTLKEATVLNQKDVKNAIAYVSAGLLDKVQYVVDLSAPYRKKQGLISRIKDWFTERRNRKEVKDTEKSEVNELTVKELRQELEDRDQKLLSYEAELKDIHNILEAKGLLALLVPPKEAEVVEQPKSDDKSDDVMKF